LQARHDDVGLAQGLAKLRQDPLDQLSSFTSAGVCSSITSTVGLGAPAPRHGVGLAANRFENVSPHFVAEAAHVNCK